VPLVGLYVAFHPPVIVCPPGNVKTSRQPLIVDVPRLVMTMFSVRPLFHAFTVALAEQVPVGELEGELDGDVEGDVEVEGEVEVDGEVDGEVGEPVGIVLANWEMNRHASADVQVRAPLVDPEPSTGLGVWSPSKAAHWTGYPARQPE
jgi:hypothetical protein